MKNLLIGLLALSSISAFASYDKVKIVDRKTNHSITVECIDDTCEDVNLIETAREGFSRVINRVPISKQEFKEKVATPIISAAKNHISFKNFIIEEMKSGEYTPSDLDEGLLLAFFFPFMLPPMIADSVLDVLSAPVKMISNSARTSSLNYYLDMVDADYGKPSLLWREIVITHKAYERIILRLSLL